MWLIINHCITETKKSHALRLRVPGCLLFQMTSCKVSNLCNCMSRPGVWYLCLLFFPPWVDALPAFSASSSLYSEKFQPWLHQPVSKQNNIRFWNETIKVGSAFLEDTFTGTYADASWHLDLRRCAETGCLPLDPPSILNMQEGWSIWSREKVLAFLLFHLPSWGCCMVGSADWLISMSPWEQHKESLSLPNGGGARALRLFRCKYTTQYKIIQSLSPVQNSNVHFNVFFFRKKTPKTSSWEKPLFWLNLVCRGQLNPVTLAGTLTF